MLIPHQSFIVNVKSDLRNNDLKKSKRPGLEISRPILILSSLNEMAEQLQGGLVIIANKVGGMLFRQVKKNKHGKLLQVYSGGASTCVQMDTNCGQS